MAQRIAMVHGAGAAETRELVRAVFSSPLDGDQLQLAEDAALIADGTLAITTDGFVVDPPAFPGGDIGKLAVCGTANDLAVRGAVPQWLTAAWIVPEGMPIETLAGFARSMSSTVAKAGMTLVAGDTKVLPASELRGPAVTTTGVGVVRYQSSIANLRVGDKLMVSSGVGEHTAALLAAREGLLIDDLPPSDCRLLTAAMRRAFEAGAHFARDATRGGLSAVLHEIAAAGPFTVRLDLGAVPVRAGVSELCEIIGLSPIELACEGCAVVAATSAAADAVLAGLRASHGGELAAIVGEIRTGYGASVEASDGRKVIRLSDTGSAIPRIC